MKHSTVYKEEDRYCSFPHVARLPDGRFAVVFRKASAMSARAARQGLATHHDPDSSIEIVFSSDEGRSWATPGTTVYKSSYGVNDPALTVLRNGDLLVRFVALEIIPTQEAWKFRTKKLFSHRVEHGLVTTVVGNVVLRSNDLGKSWSETGVANADELACSCSRDPIVEMPDGSLLMPVYTGAPQRSDISSVIRSFDGGKTWQEPIIIMSDPEGSRSQLQGINYNETSLLHLGNGELLALVRGDRSFHTTGDEFMPVGGVGELYSSRSYDGGLSWEAPRRTGIWGQPGSLIELSDGNILCTYGYRRKPYGVRCCLSRDRGRTWVLDEEYILRDDAPAWDIGYPFSIELKGGDLMTVYYFVDGMGTRHIAATHWNLR
jgi:hypothetical protein